MYRDVSNGCVTAQHLIQRAQKGMVMAKCMAMDGYIAQPIVLGYVVLNFVGCGQPCGPLVDSHFQVLPFIWRIPFRVVL